MSEKIDINELKVLYKGLSWDIIEINFIKKEVMISRYEDFEIVSFDEINFVLE